MKRIATLLLLFAFSIQVSFAALSSVPAAPATSSATATTAPVKSKKEMERFVMEKISKMTVKEYETLRGKKMNFFEKLSFKATQKRIQKQLKRDVTSGFNIGGFILGLLLGLIGVLLAYIFAKGDKNLIKWSWIGWGVWVVLVLLFLI